jgi:hypothetical protein
MEEMTGLLDEMVTRRHMIHLILRDLHSDIQLLVRPGLTVRRPTRAIHRQLPEQVHVVVGLGQQAETDTASLERVSLFVDADLVREEHLHHGFALRFLRGALREETGAEFV